MAPYPVTYELGCDDSRGQVLNDAVKKTASDGRIASSCNGPDDDESGTIHGVAETQTFYYGDNLPVMRDWMGDESVDLIYLDPPFNSEAAYNMNLREPDGSLSQAQVVAFRDYWRWGKASEQACDEIRLPRRRYLVPAKLVETVELLRRVLGDCPLMAYLVMMAVRLVEMRRVLKSTGSIYLHCDPTASHYLKLLMDALFTPQCFRNELIWRRSRSHNDDDITKYGAVHDTILFYTKSDKWLFEPEYLARVANAPKSHDLHLHTDGNWYRKGDCNPPGGRGPIYTWNGHTRPWRFSPEERDRLIAAGQIVYSRSGMPRVLRPIDMTKGAVRGAPLADTWTDIDAVNPGADEFIGWPTQKPRALLQRIIRASTREGEIVLDPFCGCGTAVIAAQGLKRQWIGIDITHLAVSILKRRMERDYPGVTYRVRGEPEDATSARRLAEEKPLEFQAWFVDKVGGIPVAPEKERKVAKGGGDSGRDGYVLFRDDPKSPRSRRMLLSVKGGESYVDNPSVTIDSLKGAMDRHGAVLGAVLMSHKPSKGTFERAKACGRWSSDTFNPNEKFQVVQVVTVDDVFMDDWRGIRFPGSNTSRISQPPAGAPGASEELFDELGQPKKPPKKASGRPPSPEQTEAKPSAETGTRKGPRKGSPSRPVIEPAYPGPLHPIAKAKKRPENKDG